MLELLTFLRRTTQLRKVERRLSGLQRIQKAKAILMNIQGATEDGAYQTFRQRAMKKRVTMEEMAIAIINANELLQSPPKSD